MQKRATLPEADRTSKTQEQTAATATAMPMEAANDCGAPNPYAIAGGVSWIALNRSPAPWRWSTAA
jgi:hypothetical protein